MYAELTYAAGGAIAGIGGTSLMFRFLNSKINDIKDKKQDKSLCDERSEQIKKDIAGLTDKIEEHSKSTHSIDIKVGQILQELKHMNGKS